MEDLWRLKEMGYRLNDLSSKAEYDRMLNRFREQEEQRNRKGLLFGIPPEKKVPEK